jgi:hypothetical protein
MRGCLEQSSSLDTGFSCSVLGWEWNEDIYIYGDTSEKPNADAKKLLQGSWAGA